MEVIWTERALDSLEKTLAFIRINSEQYTENVRLKILKDVKGLEAFPRKGRRVPEGSDEEDEVREIFVYSYRVIYWVYEEKIHILMLANTRQKRKRTSPFA
jgi:plasmid stabilization system protein ParE